MHAPSPSEPDQRDDSASATASQEEHEPRWPVLATLLIGAGLYAGLPSELAIGPRWLLPVIAAGLGMLSLITHRRGQHDLNTWLGYGTEGITTIFLLWSVVMLVKTLPSRSVAPAVLLRSAAALWLCNVLLFSLWYWRLDAGGPYARHHRGEHTEGAFLFPPMTQDGLKAAGGTWVPRFVDYLFLSFTTSTALSPTDVPVISRWAKVLVMVQALISLTIVVVLASRAVNIM